MEPVLTGISRTQQPLARSRRRRQLAIALHFPVWPDWRDAVRVLLRRARHITRVGISAGSADCTFWRSSHDREAWSDAQRAQSFDILEFTIDELGEREICSTAMLDARAPLYLQKHPQHAAVDLRGRHSEDIVCSSALVEGEYGRILTDAFEALASSTGADSLAVTHLQFGWHCFCAGCLARFHGYSWRSDWPRLPNGAIELLNPAIGKWRSAQVALVVSRLGAIARAHGKRLLFEAKFENGQDYAVLRPLIDEFIIRDELALESGEAAESAAAARYLSRALGADDYWHCIGLRAHDGLALEAQRMRLSLSSALTGGARRLWVAPSHYLSPLHWQQLDELMTRDDGSAAAVV